MSLTLLTIAGISAALAGKKGVGVGSAYLSGCDVLGADSVPVQPVRVTNPRERAYWTSVAAGATVVIGAFLINYGFHKLRKIPHPLDGITKEF